MNEDIEKGKLIAIIKGFYPEGWFDDISFEDYTLDGLKYIIKRLQQYE